MVARLKKLAAVFDLSPTAFADQIEVSRPVMSHIFSERNRPSLEVVQKIGAAFPQVSLDWLLYGKGEMLKELVKSESLSKAVIEEEKPVQLVNENALPESEHNKIQKTVEERATKKLPVIPEKRTIKVITFYSDHTFDEFYPGS